MNPPTFSPLFLSLALGGCFSPSVTNQDSDSPEGSTGGTGGSSSGGEAVTGASSGSTTGASGSTSPGTGTDAVDETGDTIEGAPPVIVEFTINELERPSTVETAQGLQLRVRAEDDGEVVFASFRRGSEVVAQGEPLGDGIFEVEWIVSGAEDNSSDPLEVVVQDDEGLEATASAALVIQMPDGGLIEEWTFDSGVISSVYGISPDPEGEEVVWVGQRTLMDFSSSARFARADGGWVDTIADDSEFASDVVRDGADLVTAISLGFGVERTTAVRFFNPQGTEANTVTLQGAPGPNTANHPLGLERDAEGRLYILSAYTSGTPGSFLMRLSGNGAVDWSRDVTGWSRTEGTPFVHDFDVSQDGRIALVGGSGGQAWVAVLDAEGALEEQSVAGGFSGSVLYDVTWTGADDLLAVGATNDGSGWSRWMRAYSDDLIPGWEDQGTQDGGFTVAVAADHRGRAVSVSTEACDFDDTSFAFLDCRLTVRKYTPDGDVLWLEQSEGGAQEFNGPALLLPGFHADVEFDRYGYVYFSAPHEFQAGDGSARSEWWMQKHHP